MLKFDAKKTTLKSIGATPITTIFEDKNLFKSTFHLHDLRFAVTLCKKNPGENDFSRCTDIQHISTISTEDKSRKEKTSFHSDDVIVFSSSR